MNILTDTPPLVRVSLPETDRINLSLVGCGGTGSHLASGLVSIAQAIQAKGKQVDLCFFDGDIVEEKNVGRQLFSPGDVGRNKAQVLAERLGMAFNTVIAFNRRNITRNDRFVANHYAVNVIVACVDNPAARQLIANAVGRSDGSLWWLDCGNDRHSGQVCIGNCARTGHLHSHIAMNMTDWLPVPSVVYPSLLATPMAVKRAKKMSCAELAAIGEQGLMVNRMVASWAGAMLHEFLVEQNLRFFATEFNTQWGTAKSQVVDVPSIAAACGMKDADIVWQPAPAAKKARQLTT